MRFRWILALSALFLARTARAQSAPGIPLVINGNGSGADVVTVHRVDPAGGFADTECVLPCALTVPEGRYDVISVDSDMREHHSVVSARAPGSRLDVDVRAHTDRTIFGTGVGLVTFGAIAITGGLVLILGAARAESSSNSNAAAFMNFCMMTTDGSPAAVMSCCQGMSGSSGTPVVTSTNMCVATNYSTEYILGGISLGVGVVGVIAGGILMGVSMHAHASSDRVTASRRRWLPVAIDTTPTAGGGVLSATFLF